MRGSRVKLRNLKIAENELIRQNKRKQMKQQVMNITSKAKKLANMLHQASGVFKGRRARHFPRAPPFWGPPLRCYVRKFSLVLMKNLLFTHIMYYKADHK